MKNLWEKDNEIKLKSANFGQILYIKIYFYSVDTN